MTRPVDFPEAYGRFLAPIRAKCRRLLGQPAAAAAADDVAQEAFVRLWQSGPPLDGTSETRTIMAWLYLTSTRLALDVLREGRGGLPLDELTVEPRAPLASPADVVAARRAIGVLCKKVLGREIEAALLALRRHDSARAGGFQPACANEKAANDRSAAPVKTRLLLLLDRRIEGHAGLFLANVRRLPPTPRRPLASHPPATLANSLTSAQAFAPGRR